MVETKRRQGQKRPDGKNSIPKPICPKCDQYLQRFYVRGIKNDKRQFIETGWSCPNLSCDYVSKDFVQLEDTQEQND
jgi:hypothetical protein